MIISILAFVFMVSFLIYEHCTYRISLGSIVASFLVGVVGAFIGCLVCAVAINVFTTMPEDAKIIEYGTKTELVALKDNFQVEGSRFLFSSVVNEKLKYTYIYDTNMGMTTGSVDADKTYIEYIGEDEIPYIQTWIKRPKNTVFEKLFLSKEGTYYTIYLPEGSIIENAYEIDLE